MDGPAGLDYPGGLRAAPVSRQSEMGCVRAGCVGNGGLCVYGKRQPDVRRKDGRERRRRGPGHPPSRPSAASWRRRRREINAARVGLPLLSWTTILTAVTSGPCDWARQRGCRVRPAAWGDAVRAVIQSEGGEREGEGERGREGEGAVTAPWQSEQLACRASVSTPTSSLFSSAEAV